MATKNARIHARKPVLSSGPGTRLPKNQRAATETCRRLESLRGAKAPRDSARFSFLLTQQGQHTLWQLVGLGHHGGAGLLQDLRTRQVGSFCCKVGIQNA